MREEAFQFPFLIWLSAGDWCVPISEGRWRKLPEISFGFYGSRSGTLLWFSFREVKLGSVWPAGEEVRSL